jgi:hypothetical protein
MSRLNKQVDAPDAGAQASADLGLASIAVAPLADAGPTPENTPVPGGGRHRWDINKPGWVDLDPPPPEDAVAA